VAAEGRKRLPKMVVEAGRPSNPQTPGETPEHTVGQARTILAWEARRVVVARPEKRSCAD